mgnify:CR=1 FL=1
MLHGMWDLSSWRLYLSPAQWEHGILTTGPGGKSLNLLFQCGTSLPRLPAPGHGLLLPDLTPHCAGRAWSLQDTQNSGLASRVNDTISGVSAFSALSCPPTLLPRSLAGHPKWPYIGNHADRGYLLLGDPLASQTWPGSASLCGKGHQHPPTAQVRSQHP